MTRTEQIMNKVARVMGESFPHYHAVSNLDTKDRVNVVKGYYKRKAKESKTPWGVAMGTGAAFGAIPGAIFGGGMSQSGAGMALGALGGAALGALIGAGMKAGDDDAIETAKGIINSSNIDARIKKILINYVASHEFHQEWERERRHNEIMDELRSQRRDY